MSVAERVFLVEGRIKKCKYLVRLKSGKTLCRVYKNRLGKEIYRHKNIVYVCMERKETLYDYPNCPFNCGYKDILLPTGKILHKTDNRHSKPR